MLLPWKINRGYQERGPWFIASTLSAFAELSGIKQEFLSCRTSRSCWDVL